MENMTLKVNEETKDLEFNEKGILQTVEGNETTAQNVRMTLTAWKKDFEPVPEHGTDYKKFFSEECPDEEREEILRDAIFQEEYIKQMGSLKIQSTGERRVSVSFLGMMENGSEINMEVNA